MTLFELVMGLSQRIGMPNAIKLLHTLKVDAVVTDDEGISVWLIGDAAKVVECWEAMRPATTATNPKGTE